MKIIHGKDYYDTANYGIDPAIMFVRDGTINVEDIDCLRSFYEGFPHRGVSSRRWNETERAERHHISLFYVFFAGTVFPAMRVIYDKRKVRYGSDGKSFDLREWSNEAYVGYKVDYIYDYDDALSIFQKSEVADDKGWFSNQTNSSKIYDHFHSINPKWTQRLIEMGIVTGYYFPANQYSTSVDMKNLYFEFNTDCMTRLQFFKIKDAFTANQDVAGYVGGVLPANTNPMVELDNKHKIMKAGFDLKTSFRKAKTKR